MSDVWVIMFFLQLQCRTWSNARFDCCGINRLHIWSHDVYANAGLNLYPLNMSSFPISCWKSFLKFLLSGVQTIRCCCWLQNVRYMYHHYRQIYQQVSQIFALSTATNKLLIREYYGGVWVGRVLSRSPFGAVPLSPNLCSGLTLVIVQYNSPKWDSLSFFRIYVIVLNIHVPMEQNFWARWFDSSVTIFIVKGFQWYG